MDNQAYYTGEVRNHFHKQKGFVFVAPLHLPKESLFLHKRDFNGDFDRLVIGNYVSYQIGSDRTGRPCAINATLLAREKSKSK